MAFFTAGQKLTAAQLNALVPATVLKTADEPITSSTTLQNDNELILPLPANASYTLDTILFYTGISAGSLKIAFTFPAGCTMHYAPIGYVMGGAFTIDLGGQLSITSGVTSTSISGGGGVPTVSLRGTILNGSTAGNLTLQWAQNASNATPTVVKAGSWIRLTRIL